MAQVEDSDVLEISARDKEREKERAETQKKEVDYDYIDQGYDNHHGDSIKG